MESFSCWGDKEEMANDTEIKDQKIIENIEPIMPVKSMKGKVNI